MKSSLPKVLHRAAGRALVDHVVRTAQSVLAEFGAHPPVAVVGSGREAVTAHLESQFPGILIAVQDPPRGTGDAVRVALPHLTDESKVAVLAGDAPLLRKESLRRLFDALDGSERPAVAFLTANLEDPGSYGRVIRDASGHVVKIVEAKDATAEEKAVCEINSGIYAFDREFLERAIPQLKPENAQGEYYLTDVLEMAFREGRAIEGILVREASEILGVNSRKELALVDGELRQRTIDAAFASGVTIVKPETVTIDDTVEFENDVVIGPFVTLAGKTKVGTGCQIGQGAIVIDTVLGANVEIRPYSVIEKTRAGDGALIGPFARLREGTDLGAGVHIGNFVETKKARLGRGAKANHLTYLGDTEIGEKTNVGAGVITCNYDGYGKHLTTIGSNVFVGSDVQLVAPVNVGDGAVIGAGTTVTKDVPGDAIATSRSPQQNLEGAARSYRERKSRKKAAEAKGH
jgi:bifunctional UDP-N-acetylglucosamine pyrophosphorylase/glucosamine-1-phosphate N-acetyltransferase